MNKPFTVSRALARELKRIDERTSREGGIPHAVVVKEWHDDMARELRRMIAAYDGSSKKAKELLECLLIAETEGVRGLAGVRRSLSSKILGAQGRRRKAA